MVSTSAVSSRLMAGLSYWVIAGCDRRVEMLDLAHERSRGRLHGRRNLRLVAAIDESGQAAGVCAGDAITRQPTDRS